MTAILPPREKWYKPDDPFEHYDVHLFCRGEGCTARLGTARGNRDHVSISHLALEPGYTDEENPLYPPGSWWRRRWELPKLRGPAAREKLKNPKSMMNTMWDAGKRRRFLEGHTDRRGEPYERGFLSPREHIIICHECGGQTKISYC